jgi:membrane-bound ClpP family serine protease
MMHSASGAPAHVSVPGTISIPWVIAAAVLVGVGLLILLYFLLSFNWLYLVGVAPVVVGGMMLFDRRAGPDHS